MRFTKESSFNILLFGKARCTGLWGKETVVVSPFNDPDGGGLSIFSQIAPFAGWAFAFMAGSVHTCVLAVYGR